MGQLFGHFCAQGVGHLLAEQLQGGFLGGGKHPFQNKTSKVNKRQIEGEGKTNREPVNQMPQHQGRQQGGGNRRKRAQRRSQTEPAMGLGSLQGDGENGVTLHGFSLLSGFHKGRGNRGRRKAVPDGFQR